MIDPSKFLEDRTGRYAAPYAEALLDMLAAKVQGNEAAYRDALERFAKINRETMGLAQVVGATLTLRAAAKAGGLEQFANEATQTILPRVTLSEALEDLVTRTPVTIREAAERTAARIAQVYAEGRNIAFVKAAEEVVTDKAKAILEKAIAAGMGENAAGRAIVEGVREVGAEWSQAYARLAFRNNVNTAVTAGQFQQGLDPTIEAMLPALMFDTSRDVDVRPNHAAGDGGVYHRRHSIWSTHLPPIGHNCRCGVIELSVPQLRRMGRVREDGTIIEDTPPAGWQPDDGFRVGPRLDLF